MKNKQLSFLIFLVIIAINLIIKGHALAARKYAAPTSAGLGDCSSWENACTLQTAINNATSGDEIWVKKGIHTPTTGNNREDAFWLNPGVKIYGGFNGDETDLNQRNWVDNQTILSGDI